MSESEETASKQDDTSTPEEEVVDDITLEKEGEQPKDTIKRLREKLREVVAQKQEYLDGWQRAKADAVNQKKEFSKERDRIGLRAKESLVQDILPVLDSFSMAMANEEVWQQVDEQWRAGVEQIHGQLVSALKSHGVEEIAPEAGYEFDPQLHSSVDTETTDSEKEDSTIARVEKIGYKINDRIIRSADVVVYKQQ